MDLFESRALSILYRSEVAPNKKINTKAKIHLLLLLLPSLCFDSVLLCCCVERYGAPSQILWVELLYHSENIIVFRFIHFVLSEQTFKLLSSRLSLRMNHFGINGYLYRKTMLIHRNMKDMINHWKQKTIINLESCIDFLLLDSASLITTTSENFQ